MANDIVPAGGDDGTLIVSVDSRQAMAGLNVLEARIYGFVYNTQNRFNTFGSSFSRIFGSMGGIIGGVTSAFGGLFAQLGKFLSLREVFNLFEGFISKTLEANRTITGFIASMSVIKGSVAAARQEYRFVLDVSKRLGIDLEASISQYHRLAASLKNVDNSGELARNLFVGVSEAATVLHAKGRDVTLIFEAIQQMASKGKLSLEELQRQLGNTLPGAVSLAARAMMSTKEFMDAGVKSATDAEQLLRKKIEDGTINVYEFLLQLSNQLKKEYSSGADYAAQQFNAAFNRMKATVFDFFKEVGDGGIADGVTKILTAFTNLFEKGAAIGGAGVGKALGDMFQDIATWIDKLDATDVQEFFEAVRLAITSTSTVVKDFFGLFQGFGGAEMETPMLDFVEFCAKTMAALVDIFRVAIAGIKTLIYSMMDLFNKAETMAHAKGDLIFTGLSKLPGIGSTDLVQGYMANKAARDQDSATTHQNLLDADRMFLFGPDETTYDKVSRQFDLARQGLTATKYGVSPIDLNFALPDYWADAGAGAGVPDFTGFGSLNYKGGTVPSYLLPGSSSNMADAYLNPMSDAEMEKLRDQIMANSSAPNSGTGGKKGGGRPDVSMTEMTRMIKAMSVAQNEYDNVLQNKNLHEGQNEAQMRALIQSDERYTKLSDQKKASLLAYAKGLDDMLLKLANAKKAQEDWNAALVAGYDAQSKIAELQSTGYVSKYRNVTDLQNSFKEGGANEMMDALNRQKELQAAMKRDEDARLLDMAQYVAEQKNSSQEMMFQADLLGRSKLEQQKMIEFHKIDLQVAQMSVGATQEQIDLYKKMAAALKVDVGAALEYVANKQNDAFTGIMGSLQTYLDSARDSASQWGDLATKSLQGTEDALVEFCLTGKASFKDLAESIIKDLVRMIIKYMLLMILQKITGVGGYSDNNAAGSLAGLGDFSLPGSAKGNIFAFANGGAFTNKLFSQPTMFAFAGGSKFGVMGEAGPEAVMPLSRNSNGELGVKIASGSAGGGESELNLTVQVFQGEGNGVKTEKSKTSNGDLLKVIIGEVASDIKKGGQVAKALNVTYGLRKTPKSYA